MTAMPETAAASPVAALREARAVVEPALRAAVERLDPETRAWCGYHLGLLDATGAPVRGGGGKGVRGALVLLGARAAGARDEEVVPAAAAVELVHEFSLVHDDLMDGDLERRHQRTVWARWGAPAAILAGDALVTLAQETVLEAPSPYRADAALLLSRTVRELVAGQVEDLAFERLPVAPDGAGDHVDPTRAIAMVAGKTGSLLATAASVGAVLAGARADVVTALRTYGAELGIAFQLVDDLLGIWGDPQVTGKPVGSDLRAGKKTLPIVHAVHHGGAAGAELARRLVDPPEGETEIAARTELIERAGGRRWAAEEAERACRRAVRALDTAEIAEPARRELTALARLLVDRES